MDSTDDNAVANEPEVRKTRSGRAVRTPQSHKIQRKTRKKMVLVEVEVSEEEEDHHEVSTRKQIHSSQNSETLAKSAVEESDTEVVISTEEALQQVIVEDSDIAQQDSNSEIVEQEQFIVRESDSSVEQNVVIEDENIVQDAEEQISIDNQDDSQSMQLQLQLDNSMSETTQEDESKEPFDVSVLNNDSQTQQHKPEDQENNDVAMPEQMEEVKQDPEAEVSNVVKHEETAEEATIAEELKQVVKTEHQDEPMEIDSKLESEQPESVEQSPEEKKPKLEQSEPDTEVISEDELPTVQAAKVPETEEVSDEELPGPKLAELPADTEVVSEDELPSVKKESTKRKLSESEYDPGSPTSESEQAAKKVALDTTGGDKKDQKEAKPRKLPELDKYWKAVNDDPTDFTGWTYLLQYVDQENDMEAAREAYDAFLSHYPYCYGYWRKYADYEKRKGNKKKCEEVFERGLKAIPLSVDLWLHYLNHVRSSKPDDEDFIRAQYERALTACGLEFRSDRLWEAYIRWETDGRRLQRVTGLYDRLLSTPTQGYTSHFDNFQEHVAAHAPNKILEVDEFLALRKEIKHMLKAEIPESSSSSSGNATTGSSASPGSEAPPGENDSHDPLKSDQETTALKERIVSIRRKIHKSTVNAVTARWNFEEGIKRPYFHVKPLERCQLRNWKEYLEFEVEQGDRARVVVLFERCLIACALYEEFWMRYVLYLESLDEEGLHPKIRDVYERACTIHHLAKPAVHTRWAMFEESCGNTTKAADILANLEKSVPNILRTAYQRTNLERRRGNLEKCAQLYEQYMTASKNKMLASFLAVKYGRFCLKICDDRDKAMDVMEKAIEKDPTNPRLYLFMIDMVLAKDGAVDQEKVLHYFDQFLQRESADLDQKIIFSQRKLEFLEDYGTDIKSVQRAYDEYQKYCKQSKDRSKKKDDSAKLSSDTTVANSAKKSAANAKDQTTASAYPGYGAYPSTTSANQYQQYSTGTQGQYGTTTGHYGTQYSQSDQYQYQNWQYPQSAAGYGGYNQWGNYGNYY